MGIPQVYYCPSPEPHVSPRYWSVLLIRVPHLSRVEHCPSFLSDPYHRPYPHWCWLHRHQPLPAQGPTRWSRHQQRWNRFFPGGLESFACLPSPDGYSSIYPLSGGHGKSVRNRRVYDNPTHNPAYPHDFLSNSAMFLFSLLCWYKWRNGPCDLCLGIRQHVLCRSTATTQPSFAPFSRFGRD